MSTHRPRLRRVLAVVATAAVLAVSGCGAKASDPTSEFHYALNAQPPLLDPLLSTATATAEVARLMFEPLLTQDADFQVQPHIAESWEESDDGKTTTFTIREGLTFHNGDPVTAEDVEASLDRWMEISGVGQQFFAGADVEVVGDREVAVHTPEKMYTLLYFLSDPGQMTAIMPKKIIDETPAEGLTEFVGTGPFVFDTWRTDQYIQLHRFEDYQSPEGEPSGLAGHREAKSDTLIIDLVTDSSTRLAGLQTGEYDAAAAIPFDNSGLLEKDTTLQSIVGENGFNGVAFNKKAGIMADNTMRNAVAAALNHEDIQLAAFAADEFYDVNGAISLPGQQFYTEAGLELFNQQDPGLAKQLMEEAGYNGEPVRILTSREYEDHYNSAVVVEENLKKAGFNTQMVVVDWATLLSMRADENAFELFTTGWSVNAVPVTQVFLLGSWPGWTDDEELSQAMNDLTFAADDEAAAEANDRLQTRVYEYRPIIKYGNKRTIVGASVDAEGVQFVPGAGIVLWNAHMTK